MATLKGQNFRILLYDTTASKYKCVGMATNCTVSLVGNTDDTGTKDDTGLASKPNIVSKNWNVTVDSLNVQDVGALLTAVKSFTKFQLLWDEVATTNNQTPSEADFARSGYAYLSDFTMSFNDREYSSKNLQFTGTGPLAKITTTPAFEAISAGSYTRGQFVRLFLSSDTTTPTKVIAAAKQLSFHVSLTMEDATTKDTPNNDWVTQEPTALNYDMSSSAFIRSADDITSQVAGQNLATIEDIYETATPAAWQIANVSGDNQRTKGAVIVSGQCVLTSLNIQGQNRSTATYDVALTGYGDYTVGA